MDITNRPGLALAVTTPSIVTWRSRDDHEWTYSLFYAPSFTDQDAVGPKSNSTVIVNPTSSVPAASGQGTPIT